MRETVLSSTFATQTVLSPTATASGSTPTLMSATSLFVAGSMTATEFGTTAIPVPESRPKARNAPSAIAAPTASAAAATSAVRCGLRGAMAGAGASAAEGGHELAAGAVAILGLLREAADEYAVDTLGSWVAAT